MAVAAAGEGAGGGWRHWRDRQRTSSRSSGPSHYGRPGGWPARPADARCGRASWKANEQCSSRTLPAAPRELPQWGRTGRPGGWRGRRGGQPRKQLRWRAAAARHAQSVDVVRPYCNQHVPHPAILRFTDARCGAWLTCDVIHWGAVHGWRGDLQLGDVYGWNPLSARRASMGGCGGGATGSIPRRWFSAATSGAKSR
jgi:hypothetical protein